jgi:hypothetical protein
LIKEKKQEINDNDIWEKGPEHNKKMEGAYQAAHDMHMHM